MKVKRQNRTFLFKGFVLVMAFALAVLCAPIDAIVALASTTPYVDYTHMTIGKVVSEEVVKTSVTQGSTYEIVKGYIGGYNAGGTNFVVGKDETGNLSSGVELVASSVVVKYNASVLDETSSADETGKVVLYADAENPYYGYFKADKLGTYTITYSYSYKIGTKIYKNSYDMRVESKLADASINFADTSMFPSIYDLSLAGENKDLSLPNPVVKTSDGKEITVDVRLDNSVKTGDYVVVTARGGATNENITISKTEDGNGLYIAGSEFTEKTTAGATDYVVKYAYYHEGNFVASTTKTTTVYAVSDPHYTNYKLEAKLASDWNDNGETGVENTLPKAIGITSKDTKPNGNETVDTSYSVKVFYKAKVSDAWKAITKEVYGDVVTDDDNGTLVDATKFKPLNDGYYTFEYTVTDAYGNSTTIKQGVYTYDDVKDEQKPTPVIYDAAANSQEDASYKLQTKAVPNGVIVYAIGMEDNVSKSTDENVSLIRKIMTDETVTKVTIGKEYSKYNLVFNYRADSSNSAAENLLANNYYLRKQYGTNPVTDADMLTWMKGHDYRIVVDNANYENIYNIFKTVTGKESKEDALEWFKTAEALDAGFVYLDCDKTFGASTNDGGLGNGQYYIHYVAKDAAGNERDVSKSMYIDSYTDDEAPKITFATTLSGTYLPDTTISFDEPTASDNNDRNMKVVTLYRYLDRSGNVITLEGADQTLKDVEEALTTENKKTYSKYLTEGNYNLLTKEEDATSLKIKLDQANADSLQIVAYAFDDKGNAGVYAKTVKILNVTDNKAPVLDKDALNAQPTIPVYMQDDEVEIPEVSVLDDAIDFVDFDLKVYRGDEVVSTYGAKAIKDKLNNKGAGRFTVNGGKFTAGTAGEYKAVVTIKDSNENTVVTFFNFTVKGRTIISEPSLSDVSLSDQTIELDDYYFDETKRIELPVPTINYQIPNSVTYDVYSAMSTDDKNALTADTMVVRGVTEAGIADNYSTGRGTTPYFRPTKVEDVKIAYTATVEVYNRDKFEWVELNDDLTDGGYYTDKTNSVKVYANADGSYKVVGTDTVVVYKENGTVKYKTVDGTETTVPASLNSINFEEYFENLKVYTLKSSEYTIKVQDTKLYDGALRYDYQQSISADAIKAAEGYDLTIKALQAQDASGIDFDKSYVELRWSLANGGNSSKRWTGSDICNDMIYNIKSVDGNVKDGTYTIVYCVYDKAGNSTTKSYAIAVGDNVKPEVVVDDDFIGTSYTVGTAKVKLDLTKVHATDASGCEAATVTLKNTSTGKTVEMTKISDDVYEISMDEVGSYTLTVEVKDKVGNTTTKTFNYDVVAKSKDSKVTYQVVGTILIVVSVVLLAGVIVYFIVSKVKLDKELKK